MQKLENMQPSVFFFKLKKVAKTIEQMNNAGDNNHLERSAYTVV